MADFVYEVSCSGERGLQDAVRTWSDAVAIPAWTALPGLSAIDAYVMATSGTHDPFVDDGAGPLLLAMLHFNTAEQMSHAIAAPRSRGAWKVCRKASPSPARRSSGGFIRLVARRCPDR